MSAHEGVRTLGPLDVSVRLERRPAGITSALTGTSLPVEWAESRARVRLPELPAVHEIRRVEA